ncbi:hypothetical protein L798_01745 [Zootermopsis nevadensis]|uniref:Uncharacterized protein n=1 Tax=Zootermopsis nevadensis TaxID=136037 RepID=A0A067QIG0_ZOONE|nr:hypothetical protein L798_01745 [Zootermopsis nevadensis]
MTEKIRIGNTYMAYKEMRNIKEVFKPRTNICKGRKGELLGNGKQILSRRTEYFEQLLNSLQTGGIETETGEGLIIYQDIEEQRAPTPTEVKETIHKLKNNKI